MMKMGFEEGMSYQDKLSYLARMQVSLIDKITMMKVNQLNRPLTVNLTISIEKEKILLIIFGASVRNGRITPASQRNNRLIAMERL
jgi:hypothetical protein